MDDKRIIELYFARDEDAIKATAAKYGRLLHGISYRILSSAEDSDECVNDTYMRAWQAIPPTRPSYLSAFLCKIVRNLSLNRYRRERRHRSMTAELIFEEIAECVPDTRCDIANDIVLRDALNGFVATLGAPQRRVFLLRYFYMRSVREIADEVGDTVGSVKTRLSRVRVSLREYLEREGINL